MLNSLILSWFYKTTPTQEIFLMNLLMSKCPVRLVVRQVILHVPVPQVHFLKSEQNHACCNYK